MNFLDSFLEQDDEPTPQQVQKEKPKKQIPIAQTISSIPQVITKNLADDLYF